MAGCLWFSGCGCGHNYHHQCGQKVIKLLKLEKSQKKLLCLKYHALNFFSSLNLIFSFIQAPQSSKPPEKYAFAGSTIPMALTC